MFLCDTMNKTVALDKISEYLIENENITGEQFMGLLYNCR